MGASKSAQTPTIGGPTSVALGFGFDQYFAVAAAGLLGLVPVASWLVSLSSFAWNLPAPSGVAGTLLQAALFALALLALLVAPPLVPCLVLRARQPRGACLEWDDEGVVEREGAWRRTFIPWQNAEAARVTWQVPTRLGTRTCTAIQVFDRITGEAVTAWEERPPGAPLVRRRLMASKVGPLVDALERRGVALDRHPDWTLLAPAGRGRPSRAVLALTRLGYVGGALAPLLAFPSPAWGVGVGAASAVLLAWRARPSVVEALTLRAPPGSRTASSDEALARKATLRAVTLEVAVRGACVVLPIAASVANALHGD